LVVSFWFLTFFAADVYTLFAAFNPCQIAVADLLFSDVLDDSIPARLGAVMGQQDASRFYFSLGMRKSELRQYLAYKGSVADHLDAFTAI
jgi:hypothetical protein